MHLVAFQRALNELSILFQTQIIGIFVFLPIWPYQEIRAQTPKFSFFKKKVLHIL